MSRRSGHRAWSSIGTLPLALAAMLALPFLSPFADRDRARAAESEWEEVSSVTGPALSGGVLNSIDFAILWLGVTVEETAGQLADLQVDVLHNGTVVGTGQTQGEHMWGPPIVTSSVIYVNLALFEPVSLEPGDTLGVRVLVKRSHEWNLRVRLWYGGRANANGASFIRGLVDGKKTRFFLTGPSCTHQPQPCLRPLSTSAGKKVRGSVVKATAEFKPFGTWELVVE